MILRALYDLYRRFEADPEYDVAPPGRSYQKVTFVVVLELDGTLVGIHDARLDRDGRRAPRRVLVPGGAKPSGAGLNPCFLWDAPGYLLGWDPRKPDRATKAFEAFRRRHLDVEVGLQVPELAAVCRFLEAWDPANASAWPILEEVATGYGVFQVRGQTRYVHEHPEVAQWWDRHIAAEEPGPLGQCLVTDAIAPVARLHKPPIKGVKGTLAGGGTIVGLDDRAYWSYGLKQSFNAPVSEEAAHRYANALNALLDGPRRDKHRVVVGATTVAFWTDRPTPTEDIFAPFLSAGSSLQHSPASQDDTLRVKLELFFMALRKGREAYGELEQAPERTGYFILGLAAPTPARVAVRFAHCGTLAQLLTSLRRHRRDIQVERRFGDGARRPEPEFTSLGQLLDQTCPLRNGKPDRDKIPAVLEGPLLLAVITGSQYPPGLFSSVIRRIVADRMVNYPRACVIKGYLARNLQMEVPMSLDLSRVEPAYRLGRLFAALERTQLEAFSDEKGRPTINATIRDRFYSSASATPGAVIPRLLRTYQHHLSKLEGGRKVNREKLVQEIMDPLSGIPAHLSLADQGLFALGYYHQMNAFYQKKDDRAESPTT